MSKITNFEIALEHDIDEQYQYEPGEMLRGQVSLLATSPVKIKAVLVQIKGDATVSWGDETGKSQQNYRADETYIDITQNLLQARGVSVLDLPKGRHSFPLEYTLPYNLPSSFIGKYGSITYVVKATLKEDKKFGMSTMITSEPFLVLRRLDLSIEEELLKPKESTVSKRLWGALAFCLSGKVATTLKVNKTGHLPGEDIFMDAEITNSSPRIIKAVQASVIMHSTFHAKNYTKYNTQIVNKKRDDWEMSYGEGRRWKNVRLTIPPYIPESRLDGCDIIDIRYELLFKIEVSGGHELKISMPITVGTVQGNEGVSQPAPSAGQSRVWRSNKSEITSPGGTNSDSGINGNSDMNGDVVDPEDLEIEAEHEDFRHPINPGQTRKNPIFDNE